MPTRDEAQRRLERTLSTFTTALNLKLDARADNFVLLQIAQAAERIEREAPPDAPDGDDEAILARADSQLMRWIFIAARGGYEERFYRPVPPARRAIGPPVVLTMEEVEPTLLKLCPGFWPFC